MRLNACVNEMGPFGPSKAIIKGKTPFTLAAMAQKEICLRDEIADPPGTNMLPIDRHGFAEDFVYFRTLCGV